jgi:ankyrin repeat protein
MQQARTHAPSRCVALDSRIDEVVLRAMAADREFRYQQVSELREGVERITRRRSRIAWPIAAALLLGTSIIAGALLWRDRAAVAVDPYPPVWENSLGMKFRPLPGSDIRMSIWETRLVDWQAFEKDAGLPAGAKRATGNPLDPITVDEADRIRAFCAWLTRKERAAGRIGRAQIYRLPSDREWSLAVDLHEAADTAPLDLHLKDREHYPWGTRAPVPDTAGNYADSALRERIPNAVVIPNSYDGHAFAAAVGSFPANKAGFHDLGGNLWEAVTTNGADEDSLLFRGGSWFAGAGDGDWTCLLASFRARPNTVSHLETGFRVVLAKEGTKPGPTLLAAAREGDLASLTKLLAAGADLSQGDATGRSALHRAARGGHADAVAALIQAGADVEAKDKGGETPLHCAAFAGSLPAVRALVQAGAKVRTRAGLSGVEPIHLAVSTGPVELLEYLASQGADLQVTDNFGGAPLHCATTAGAHDAIEWLAVRQVPLDAPGFGKMTALGMAAMAGDEEICALLLRLGASANPETGAPLSPLAWAVTVADPEVVELLLRQGADPQPVAVGSAVGLDPVTYQHSLRRKGGAGFGKLPLLMPAAEPGKRAAVIRLLAGHGMPLEQRDPQGYTPLLNAAYRGNSEAVQTLLELGAKPDAADHEGFTALHSAAEQGFVKIVELLLAKGAQPDVPNGTDRSALDCAVLTGHREVVERLLAAGAKVEGLPQSLSTPVQTAAVQGHAAVLALLLERGGNPNAAAKKSGMTGLIGAALTAPGLIAASLETMPATNSISVHGEPADYVGCVRLLLEHGAKPRIAMKDGTTALHAAATSNQAESVALLLQAGEAPDVLDRASFTPLHRTAQHDAADAAKVLLDHGASLAHPLNPYTPLHSAAAAGAVKVATLLLERGAAVNLRDGKGGTPLHWAVGLGQVEMVAVLAKHGADLAARDFVYNTPLHCAVSSGKPEIVSTLLDAGANPALRNIEGATPLDIATLKHFDAIVAIFSQATPTPLPNP